MSQAVRAFSPGHISGYFRRVEGSDPASTGSVGGGVVIDEGVIASAEPGSSIQVTVRRLDAKGGLLSESTGSPPVEYALGRLGVHARITTSCRLPIGAGFGMSAAAILSSVTAVNELLGLGLSRETIAGIAHESEVIHRTGLGDVAACQGGGFVVRKKPGIHDGIDRFFPEGCRIFALSFGPISTPDVLGSPDAMAKVAAAFPEEHPGSVRDIVSFSRRFSEASGLITPEVRNVLDTCDRKGIPASMTMLGNGVFATGKHAEETLAGFGEVYGLSVAKTGVHLLEETT